MLSRHQTKKQTSFQRLPHPRGPFGRFAPRFRAPDPAGPFAALAELAGRPLLWAVLAVLVLAGYGYAMAVPAVDMDDLAIDTYFAGGEFLRQGRVTVWLLQALTGILTWRPFWPELFAAVCLALAGLGLAALVSAAAGRRLPLWQAALLAGGLLLWPYHAEILMYANQSGIGLGYLLCMLAAMLAWRHLFGGWRAGLPGAAGAAACLALALGLYESFAPVWLTLVFAMLLLRAGRLDCCRTLRERLSAAARGRLAAGGGHRAAPGPQAAAVRRAGRYRRKRHRRHRHLLAAPRQHGRGAAPSVREWLQTYVARAFGVPALALLAAACLGAVCLGGGPPRAGVRPVCGGACAGPVFAGHPAGHRQPAGPRQPVLCGVRAFVFWLLLQELAGRRPPAGRRLAALLAVLVLAAECLALNDIFWYNRQRWQYEQAQLQGIAARLDELDPDGALPVVFCGSLPLPQQLHDRALIPLDNAAYRVSQAFTHRLGGVVGELFRYENPQTMVVAWAQGAFGTHEQTYRLMELAGRSCAAPTAAQQLAGEQLAESLPVWPAEGSVSLQDGYLLVCLGEA